MSSTYGGGEEAHKRSCGFSGLGGKEKKKKKKDMLHDHVEGMCGLN